MLAQFVQIVIFFIRSMYYRVNACYPYELLSKQDQEIRLLRFSNSPTPKGSSVEPIRISLSLETVSRHDKPQYTAISYVWGDPHQTLPISVNGYNFNVTRNLHAALEKLQHDESIDKFWVDAICINQKDEQEKTWQVQQMANLYGEAAMVLFWIGESANNSDEAMDELESIGSDAFKAGILQLFDESAASLDRRRRLSDHLEQSTSECRVLDESSVESLVVNLDSSKKFRSPSIQESIRSLLDRDIWRRAWIVQEISLSDRAYIVCGDKRLSIDCFDSALAIIILCQEALYAIRTDLKDCFPVLKPALLNLRGLNHRRKRKLDRKPRLSSLLMHQHRRQHLRGPKHAFLAATDPRDIIFALLEVAGDTVPRLRSKLGIEPDYKKSTEIVFTETTRAFLTHCPWYRLEYCTLPKNLESLPSWVPDWSKIAAEGVSCNPISIWNFFTASADETQPQTSPSVSSEITVLLRSGSRVDVVTAVMDSPQRIFSGVDQDFRIKDRHAWLEKVRDFGGMRSPSLFQAELWRTLVADIQRDRRTGRTSRMDGTWMELTSKIVRNEEKVMIGMTNDEIAGLRKHLPLFGQAWWPLIGSIDPSAEQMALVAYSSSLFSWAEWIGHKRTLFKTAKGRLGLGPENMRAKDIVTIIFGTQVPIILRPANETQFEFIGEAYVHGIMDGEFMALDPPHELFELV